MNRGTYGSRAYEVEHVSLVSSPLWMQLFQTDRTTKTVRHELWTHFCAVAHIVHKER